MSMAILQTKHIYIDYIFLEIYCFNIDFLKEFEAE